MQGLKRRIVYITFYELIAIVAATAGLALLSGSEVGHAGVAAIAASAVAVVWNFVFNSLFERWEARQAQKGRGFWRRVAHAVAFEAGLVVTLVPLFAWWLEISLWQAFVLDLGLIVFFLIYTFFFNLAFDKIFGLPASAQQSPVLT
ncbi:PACE efflux transporter [Hydrogenophaga sp.]|uniref:PACE efflux transporter n=1 Tax=Hydrogenophaga sp. TaxID=1904254 RepID=UPI0027187E51|nr:PACE efflux transporter [Hydrogenophaga sp.]MDO9434963.1 PACE efflux transporter [Hydrogenophaga sp.]